MSTFKDFIGQEITEGCYVAYPGAGNVKAEYGLILYRVTGFDLEKKKIKAQRLDVNAAHSRDGSPYEWHKSFKKRKHMIDPTIYDNPNAHFSGMTHKWMISMIESSLENPNKLVVVNPPQLIRDLFDSVYNGDEKIFEKLKAEQVSAWILASTYVDNPFKF